MAGTETENGGAFKIQAKMTSIQSTVHGITDKESEVGSQLFKT